MIISDTSALVLNWTSHDIWKSEQARNYFNDLDLSAADPLFKKFGAEINLVQRQQLSNRKYFVRKCAVEFLEKCRRENAEGQVIILAAGIDPLSVEIASLYPESNVFDVDKYSMQEKKEHLKNICPNIRFIDCDITNIAMLSESLAEKGWLTDQPTMLIMEGITYYLRENDLRNVLSFFASKVSGFVCDFGLDTRYLDGKAKLTGEEIRKKIMESVDIEFMSCYEPGFFIQLVKQSGFPKPERFTMDKIQLQRTGERTPFEGDEPAWVAMVSA